MDYVLLFLPALIANGAPPVFAKIFPKFLNTPIDFGLKFRGKRLLGDHKTIRGFVSGIIIGALTYLLIEKQITIEIPLYFGALVGLTVLTFDSLKSFLKSLAVGVLSVKSAISKSLSGLLLPVTIEPKVTAKRMPFFSAIFLIFLFL